MPLTSITTPNPWTMLTTENIAQCDQPFFDKYGGVTSYQNLINSQKFHPDLDFSCLPDPFCGDPESKVYCLNKNPGKPDKCFIGDNDFEKATKDNLELKQQSCFWAESIPNKCGKVHDGVEWLTKRTRELETILGRHPNIFFVEYFPYHSSSGFDFPCHLPSYTFTDELILQAMKDGKMIIIMREKRNWLKRIPGLENYKNLYTLKYAQSGYLTLNNVINMDTEQHLTEDEVKQYF